MQDQLPVIGVLPSKVAPPELSRFFERPSLTRRLAELSAAVRRVWISSPGGAGKTSLVRALLASERRPFIWYNVGEEDHDPASFFFYLAQTVPGRKRGGKLLPTFTADYLPNMPVFCQNFFRAYFAGFRHGCVLVLDDFQEGPGEPFFGPVLAAALTELPANSALFVLSREEPYPSLARHRLNRSLAHLGWEDLRLSAEETRRFLFWAQGEEPSLEDTDRAYGFTQGWLAGLLLLSSGYLPETPSPELSTERTQLLFDYFAGETFVQLPGEMRGFLLTCALLPAIDAGMAARLTGRSDAGEILQRLARGNQFTFRVSTNPEVYRFHPLFRQFLQAQAVLDVDPQTYTEMQAQAARLLLDAGLTEAAAELLIAARNWSFLIDLIFAHAEGLLHQSRSQTLLTWLQALPDELHHSNPWLCFWHGCCLTTQDPARAIDILARAYALFDVAGNPVGSMLSWATVVYAIVVGWNDLTELDDWVKRFYSLRERYPCYPSAEIEALMIQAIFQALTWRQPSHPELPAWAARLHHLVAASGDRSFRVLAGADLVLYHTLIGDLASAIALIESVGPDLAAAEVPPVRKLVWFGSAALSELIALPPAVSLATVATARSIVAESGIHALDVRIHIADVIQGLTAGDLASVRRSRNELKAVPLAAAVDKSFACLFGADLASLEGDPTKAVALAEMAVASAESAGTPIVLSESLAVLVVVLHQSGQQERARAELARGLATSTGMNFFTCVFKLLAAFFAFEDGNAETALRLLSESLTLAARQRYLTFHPWRGEIMGRLCREAVVAGIEVEYVKRLASDRSLDLAQPELPALTPKEIEILRWVKAGKTNWEIARIQGVSERTVKFHVGNILHKLGASTRAHAVSVANERSLITPG